MHFHLDLTLLLDSETENDHFNKKVIFTFHFYRFIIYILTLAVGFMT